MTIGHQFFAPDDPPGLSLSPWKIVVVDDDENIQRVTQLILKNMRFFGRQCVVTCFSTTDEAIRHIEKSPDIAVIIVDLVMETETSGLDLVRHLREDVGNKTTRVIVRTGQSGQNPEHIVLRELDINDYREKTDLTTAKLVNMIFSAVRSYIEVTRLEENYSDMKRAFLAATTCIGSGSGADLHKRLLSYYIEAIFGGQESVVGALIASGAPDTEMSIKAACGKMAPLERTSLDHLHGGRKNTVLSSLESKSGWRQEDGWFGHSFSAPGGGRYLFLAEPVDSAPVLDATLCDCVADFAAAVVVQMEKS